MNSGVNGIVVQSWNDWGNGYVASTRNYNGKDGYWDRVIAPGVRAGRWYIAVFDGANNLSSEIITLDFTASCDPSAANVQEKWSSDRASPTPSVQLGGTLSTEGTIAVERVGECDGQSRYRRPPLRRSAVESCEC